MIRHLYTIEEIFIRTINTFDTRMETLQPSLSGGPKNRQPHGRPVLVGITKLDVAADVGGHQGGAGLGQQLRQDLPTRHTKTCNTVFINVATFI